MVTRYRFFVAILFGVLAHPVYGASAWHPQDAQQKNAHAVSEATICTAKRIEGTLFINPDSNSNPSIDSDDEGGSEDASRFKAVIPCDAWHAQRLKQIVGISAAIGEPLVEVRVSSSESVNWWLEGHPQLGGPQKAFHPYLPVSILKDKADGSVERFTVNGNNVRLQLNQLNQLNKRYHYLGSFSRALDDLMERYNKELEAAAKIAAMAPVGSRGTSVVTTGVTGTIDGANAKK